MFRMIRRWYWRKTYRPGKTVSRFLAPDIRRDVAVLDISKLADGIITAKTCTWNVLYQVRGIAQKPAFGEVRDIEIRRLWEWPGQSWGGPVPPNIDGEP